MAGRRLCFGTKARQLLEKPAKASPRSGLPVSLIWDERAEETLQRALDLLTGFSGFRQPPRGQRADAAHMLAIRDNLGNMQHYYDKANEHMHMAFQHIRKAGLYLSANDIYIGQDYDKILELAYKNINDAKAEFGRKHRRDAWMHVFSQMEFHKWLDKKQREDFVRDIERNGNIPFTKENIRGTLENVFLQRGQLFEQSVANVFDELTRYYKGKYEPHGRLENQ